MTASILVVDDERAIQEILDFTLTGRGISGRDGR